MDLNADIPSQFQQQVGHTKIPENFPVLTAAISYTEFFETYIVSNMPCLIRIPGFIDNWKSSTEWKNRLWVQKIKITSFTCKWDHLHYFHFIRLID